MKRHVVFVPKLLTLYPTIRVTTCFSVGVFIYGESPTTAETLIQETPLQEIQETPLQEIHGTLIQGSLIQETTIQRTMIQRTPTWVSPETLVVCVGEPVEPSQNGTKQLEI